MFVGISNVVRRWFHSFVRPPVRRFEREVMRAVAQSGDNATVLQIFEAINKKDW